MQGWGNFGFLDGRDERLGRLGALAERYFYDDAPAALIKLRQFAEFLTKEIAARHALLPSSSATFDDVLRALKVRSVLPADVADLLCHLKRVGNAAAHEDRGSASEALNALKMARVVGIWFHKTYRRPTNFAAGPFVPPARPADASRELMAEVERLRNEVRASADGEAKARLALQEAEAARLAAWPMRRRTRGSGRGSSSLPWRRRPACDRPRRR